MKILLTGSAGFIGHHVSRILLENDYEVIGVDDLNNYYSPELKSFRNQFLGSFKNYKFIIGDIANSAFVDQIFKSQKIDAVVHLAAQAGVRLPASQNSKYTFSNLVGFENIATNVLLHQIKFFIYASSSSVYGDLAKTPLIESEILLKPNSYYGVTKLSNELSSKVIFNESGISARGLRFFSVYGPLGRPDMAYFRVINALLNKKTFELFGNGLIRRDFTFIDDAAKIVTKLLEDVFCQSEQKVDVVNVGGGNPMSILDLIEITNKISGKDLDFSSLPANLNDSAITMADSTYLYSLIGEKPATTLEEGIRKTYEWASSLDRNLLDSWVVSSK